MHSAIRSRKRHKTITDCAMNNIASSSVGFVGYFAVLDPSVNPERKEVVIGAKVWEALYVMDGRYTVHIKASKRIQIEEEGEKEEVYVHGYSQMNTLWDTIPDRANVERDVAEELQKKGSGF